MVVGALSLTLFLPEGGSLKAKRKVVRALCDRLRSRFNVAAAEVGANDRWQRIELGLAVCGNRVGFVERQMDELVRFVERLALAELSDVRREVITLEEMAWAPAGGAPWAE